jgi:DNA-binding winged helix-turn-helix (wHTH) protein
MPDRTFQFGVFEVNAVSGELRKNGARIKVQEQPFQILLLLLERPGEIIGREEIRAKLWAENTFVDFDNAISSAVRKLREALGDNAENPRFIETLAKRGYRFIGQIDVRSSAIARHKPVQIKIFFAGCICLTFRPATIRGVNLGSSGKKAAPYGKLPGQRTGRQPFTRLLRAVAGILI